MLETPLRQSVSSSWPSLLAIDETSCQPRNTRLALGTNISARNQEIGAESRKRQAAEQTQIEDKKSRNRGRNQETRTGEKNRTRSIQEEIKYSWWGASLSSLIRDNGARPPL